MHSVVRRISPKAKIVISEKFEDATIHHSTLTEELQHEISTSYKVKLTPNVEQAKLSKQPPTDGEIYLLQYLEKNLDCESEVYFQPVSMGIDQML